MHMSNITEVEKGKKIISDNDGCFVATDANLWLEQVAQAEETKRKDLSIKPYEEPDAVEMEAILTRREHRKHTNGHRSLLASNAEYDGSLGGGTPRNPLQTGGRRPVNS